MATRVPFSANLSLRNTAGDILQRFTRINPGLNGSDLEGIMEMVNDIRRTDQSVIGGAYTIMDELRGA